MSVETERSSTESSGASGLDFEDTALTLTLRLPGADPDRKRSASSSSPDAHHQLSSAAAAAAANASPAPKCVPSLTSPTGFLVVATNCAGVSWN
jgi:auxin-responsive protein IAA